MKNTVLGFFDDPSEATEAMSRLKKEGIGRERLDISTSLDLTSNTIQGGEDKDRKQKAISGFFRSLFGNEVHRSERYRYVAERSHAILTVHTDSAAAAERAAEIMDDCGAVNVDERALELGFTDSSDQSPMDPPTLAAIEAEGAAGAKKEKVNSPRGRSCIVDRQVEDNMRLREVHLRMSDPQYSSGNKPGNERSDEKRKVEQQISEREKAEQSNRFADANDTTSRTDLRDRREQADRDARTGEEELL